MSNTKRRCSNCRSYFLVDDMEFTGISSFCTYECMLEKQSTRKQPSKNIKKKPRKSGAMDSKIRDKIIERDFGRCRSCQTTRTLHVHHIRYRSEGGRDTCDNLITLCLECHELVHSSKKKYQEPLIHLVDEINDRNRLDFVLADFLD